MQPNTFQTSTFLATAFWKFRKKIMQALDFLHCDHVIKIQCRKSTPCRISFAAVCDLVTFHPCLCKSCIREIFLSSINKNKKYWCFVLPWFSMSVEIEAQQQSSLQWGYKVSWLSRCWTWIPHLEYSKIRKTGCLGRVANGVSFCFISGSSGDFRIDYFTNSKTCQIALFPPNWLGNLPMVRQWSKSTYL